MSAAPRDAVPSAVTVTELWVYPIKSARGLRVDAAVVEAGGFALDRRWMLVDPDGGFVSQRKAPALACVVVHVDAPAGALRVEAPGQSALELPLAPPAGATRAVTVWDDTCEALTAGPDAARWFTAALRRPVELVHLPDNALRAVDTRYAAAAERVGFADGFPFLLASTASLAALNARLAAPVPMDRFRPNIVVTGCDPFAEDVWDRVAIGAVPFRVAKPCARCVMVNVDQATGVASPEPLAALAGFRKHGRKVLFGQNLLHQGLGTVRVGDAVVPLGTPNPSPIFAGIAP